MNNNQYQLQIQKKISENKSKKFLKQNFENSENKIKSFRGEA